MILALLIGLSSASVHRLDAEIAHASAQTGLPAPWIAAVIAAESGGRAGPHGRLRSPVGAMGVMQVMPKTWVEMAATSGRTLDPDMARDNIEMGSAYLKMLYRRFGFPGAFAAYHGGPSGYQRALSGSKALPSATRTYVDRIFTNLNGLVPPGAPAPRDRVTVPRMVTRFASTSAPHVMADCDIDRRMFVCLAECRDSEDANEACNR